ncbi:type A chloramphenicol O-acetyltransferase [Sandaracinus amylolyticus]|uniref:type A chloramphenicol O-acetyltransferase n=1 Tax=Sandaracinus amylolyticus TaxID=927083 RepID=UPI001EFEF61F|nr:type A chloramphenicol O-acetyltransferase [Sandaracinus amylolyticus]UJR78530.1 Type A chloramphenicol O-acetyltransferase [Sandaracinus amylolyticus]
MAELRPVDLATWNRAEHFRHYLDRVPCTYSFTVHLDVTGLRAALASSGRKAYPAQLWMLATAVNRFRELRMAFDADGALGAWDEVHPAYTVFNREAETFSGIWTRYDADFASFEAAATRDIEEHSRATRFFPKDGRPPNAFDVSSIPWLEFSAFTLDIPGAVRHLAPIFTLGRYVERDGATLLPVAIQVHHAVCDGYHAGRLVAALQELATGHEAWLSR